MSALNVQVGGSHYKDLAVQPIELIAKIRCSFIQGCIIKYISRYKNKNGAQDLKKVIHYAKLAMLLNDKRVCNRKTLSSSVAEFVNKNNLTDLQARAILRACHNRYDAVVDICFTILKAEYPRANMREFSR